LKSNLELNIKQLFRLKKQLGLVLDLAAVAER